ncbi:MAG: IS110 family transposase [Acidiphilium sp.]|uniref:IS110 family transposase n=1 Tax=Facivitalis istanbulensis TaxID=3075838 RepID=UPI00349AF9F8|nr:IS110 family transposase [Acidiphilium sp.]
MAFIGVDLHQNSFTVCRREAGGTESFETYQLARADLDRFCATLDADDEIAVEATGNSAWFRDEVAPCVGRVAVVNPRQFQVIRKSVSKTDRNDARALALFLSKDMLPETRLKSKAETELGSPVHTRDLLVKQRTRLLNKIHALFNRHGVKLKKEGLASKRRLLALEIERFSALEQVELRVVRDQALSLTAAIADLDAEIRTAAQGLDGFDSLVSIKGIGPRAAAVFLSGIGKVDDFESADKLAAYLGIVPRVSQSNETDNRGRITKRGNKLMRTTLVQCTLIAIRYSGYLNAYYRRIRERRGSGKAIIATARKFLGIIYNTLKNKWVFEDFTSFKIANGPITAGQSS